MMTSAAGARNARPGLERLTACEGSRRWLSPCSIFQLSVARAAPDWLPSWIRFAAEQGGMGVDVFFVHQWIRHRVQRARRQVYAAVPWALCASSFDPARSAVLVDDRHGTRADRRVRETVPVAHHAVPSVPMILSHLVYMQELLNYGHILPIFWTLCFEIQFYLMFVGMLVLWQPLKPRIPIERRRLGRRIRARRVVRLSVLIRVHVIHSPYLHGVALQRWFEFFLGVLTWWWVSKQIPLSALIAAYGVVLLSLIGFEFEPSRLLAPLVSLFIVSVAAMGKLETVLSNRPLQFLGRFPTACTCCTVRLAKRWISFVEREVGFVVRDWLGVHHVLQRDGDFGGRNQGIGCWRVCLDV